MKRTASLAAFLVVATGAVLPSHAGAKGLPELLAYRPSPAGQTAPRTGSARGLAEAKRKLARGDPKGALRTLANNPEPLFEDRAALLKGDALLALQRTQGAVVAYRRALERAQVEFVALSAARGLVAAYGSLNDRKRQLRYVNALLAVRRIARRPNLLAERTRILFDLGRNREAAQAAWRLLVDYPSSSTRKTADRILTRLKRRGVKIPVSSARWELARIRNLVRSRAFRQAERALDAFERRHRALRKRAWAKRAELYRRAGRRDKERKVLQRLYRAGLERDDGPAVLFRLGRIAMNESDHALAIRYFDELKKRFRRADETEEGQYLAGWLAYNDGNHRQGTERLLEFARAFPKSKKRTEALWFAGWSSYDAGALGRARTSWEQLIDEHPTSTLVTHARYWVGRIFHRQNKMPAALAAYQRVVRSSPLSYYGFWAATRLDELGQPVEVTPPPEIEPPASIETALARLGNKRPINLDRAVLLHRANLTEEARHELDEAERALEMVRDTEGRTIIADLLQTLGAHHLAFRVGMRVVPAANPLQQDAPWVWRAWRHAYPLAFLEEVERAQKAHGTEPALILSIMRTESRFRPHVRSPAGARGLMQLMPATARHIGKRAPGGRRHAARYRQPTSNVWLGTWYLKSLLKRYKDQLPAAIGAYNAGPIAMNEWLERYGGRPLDEFVERIPYRETRQYTRRVLETFMVYRRLYGGDMPQLLAKMKDYPAPADAITF